MGVRGETPQAGGTGGGRNYTFSGSSKGCVVVPAGSGWLRPTGEPLLPRRVNSHKLVVTCVFHVGRGRAGRRGHGDAAYLFLWCGEKFLWLVGETSSLIHPGSFSLQNGTLKKAFQQLAMVVSACAQRLIFTKLN